MALVPLPFVGAEDSDTPINFVVITHPDVQIETISRTDLRSIFLMRKRTWPNGTVIRPVDQSEASTVRAAFSLTVHGKSSRQIADFWHYQMQAGRNRPPSLRVSDAEVVDFVRSTPGAIGYISLDTATDDNSIRTVTIDQ